MYSINIICSDYLHNGLSDEVSSEEIEAAYIFCNTKISELTDIRDGLKLKHKSNSFQRIGHSLDLITHNDLSEFNILSVFYQLESELNSVIERLSTLLDIIIKMNKELE